MDLLLHRLRERGLTEAAVRAYEQAIAADPALLEGSSYAKEREKEAWHVASSVMNVLVVALMLFFAFWYAYSYYEDSKRPRASSSPTCTSTATSTAKTPSQVTVNVYNATERAGTSKRQIASAQP